MAYYLPRIQIDCPYDDEERNCFKEDLGQRYLAFALDDAPIPQILSGLDLTILSEYCLRLTDVTDNQSHIRIPKTFYRKDQWPYYTPQQHMRPFIEIFEGIYASILRSTHLMPPLEQLDEMLAFLAAFRILGMAAQADQTETIIHLRLQGNRGLRVQEMKAMWSFINNPHSMILKDGQTTSFTNNSQIEWHFINNLRKISLIAWEGNDDDYAEVQRFIKSQPKFREFWKQNNLAS
ncbi:hypothetical protein BDV96DRAFT_642950 [Lophiotrema nucula]|uniref:Uncharacterized protein n=1 Tax=Lophiotrema nucula TaxID=690887 RepID=A0A6A5ZHR1_9PLEO|nr:hypothetical protein BDV96DRAFT_642950 [Lophiotrema nucula]